MPTAAHTKPLPPSCLATSRLQMEAASTVEVWHQAAVLRRSNRQWQKLDIGLRLPRSLIAPSSEARPQGPPAAPAVPSPGPEQGGRRGLAPSQQEAPGEGQELDGNI